MKSFLETLWDKVEAALTAAAFAEERDLETAREMLARDHTSGAPGSQRSSCSTCTSTRTTSITAPPRRDGGSNMDPGMKKASLLLIAARAVVAVSIGGALS